MAIDLTGGIDPAREYMFAERPDNPEMRDSVSFWVFDDRGEVGLPRIGIEAVAANWDAHNVQVNVAFPDGRVYRLREDAAEPPRRGPRRQADGAGRRPARVHVRRAVQRVDGDVRRPGGPDVIGRSRRGPQGRTARRCAVRGRGEAGGAAVGAGRTAGRRGFGAEDVDRGRPDGRRRATSSCSARPARCGSAGASTRSPAAGCGSDARACAGSRGSGATAGSRRCSPAAGRSATSPTRRARTASRRSTRVMCSPATAS